MSLPLFRWLSRQPCPPARWDLRFIDWGMTGREDAACAAGHVPGVLDWRSFGRPGDWEQLPQRGTMLAIGVDDAGERAQLLDCGLGDAVGSHTALVELAARLLRLPTVSGRLPRLRQAGPLVLDLFHRDARDGPSWLGLHPREFALLWRLAETPHRPVSRRTLLADVWRLDHVPETNSLEVHVSRLRAKLAVSRCAWLVRTHPLGGYQLGETSQMLDRPVAIGNGVCAR